MKKFLPLPISICLAVLLAIFSANVTLAATMFTVQSIDTMKFSRDRARDPAAMAQVPTWVAQAAQLGPTHIAVDTPYDAEFYPYLLAWADEVHNRGLSVWFRGNWSSWEGWFGYAKFSNPMDHIGLTTTFITQHPELFKDGDIFTPAPEPENGGFGDPRTSVAIKSQFLTFLVDSYTGCKSAMETIHKQVICGYYSVNGDVAKQVLTKEVVDQTGGVVAVDHYVKDPVTLKNDLVSLHQQFDVPIVLSEFGAPIPEINGSMTESQQAEYINQDLSQLAGIQSIIQGVNYWTAFDSSTELFNPDGSARAVVDTIKRYFMPLTVISGVINTPSVASSQPVANIPVTVNNTPSTAVTDDKGHYTVAIPAPQPTKLLPTPLPKVTVTSTPLEIIAGGVNGFATSKELVMAPDKGEVKHNQVVAKQSDWYHRSALWVRHQFEIWWQTFTIWLKNLTHR